MSGSIQSEPVIRVACHRPAGVCFRPPGAHATVAWTADVRYFLGRRAWFNIMLRHPCGDWLFSVTYEAVSKFVKVLQIKL